MVTDRRYERLVRAQVPEAALVLEPMGRNTAAAIALAVLAIDRPEDEVMIVLPADAHIDPAREGVYRDILGKAARHLATGAVGIADPLVTLGTEVKRPATEYGYLVPKLAQRRGDRRPRASTRWRPSRRSPNRHEPRSSSARSRARPGTPGCSCGGGGRSAPRSSATPGCSSRSVRWSARRSMLEHAYEAIQRPVSIDVAVMEGAAQSGDVVMGSMDVGWSDLGSWSALLEALGARGTGAVVQPGERVEVEHDDLIVRRIGGRLGVIAPPERGRMTATQPIAVLRGTGPDRAKVEELLERCSDRED